VSLTPVYANKFRKDFEKAEKQGRDMTLIKNIMVNLIDQIALDRKYIPARNWYHPFLRYILLELVDPRAMPMGETNFLWV
jgi:hypothetical protein